MTTIINLHPSTLAAIAEGPQLVKEVPLYDGSNVRIYETPEAFARRIALIAMEEEREECAKVCEEAAEYHRRFADSVSQLLCVSNASAIRRRGKP